MRYLTKSFYLTFKSQRKAPTGWKNKLMNYKVVVGSVISFEGTAASLGDIMKKIVEA